MEDIPLWFKLKMAPDGKSGFLWIGDTNKSRRFIGAVKIEYCQRKDSGEFVTLGTLETSKP